MIRLTNLTLQRGPQRLLDSAEMTLHAGHKAGLIGANGAGKSSLFALLRGELTPDGGDCQLPGDWRIAHMRQEVDTLERVAVDYVLDGDLRLRQVRPSWQWPSKPTTALRWPACTASWRAPTVIPLTPVRASCWPALASVTSRWTAASVTSPVAGECA